LALWDLFSKKKSPQDLLLAGNLQGALKGFKRELKAKNNKDPLLMLKIGSIYQQMSDNIRARMYYMAVGEHYGEHGFFNKAVAAYKKALEITPNDRGILEKLASYNNKVPKYMVNSQILDQIRLNAEESAIKENIQSGDPGIDDSQNIDATFRFPDPEDDPIPFDVKPPASNQTAEVQAPVEQVEKPPSAQAPAEPEETPEIAAIPIQEEYVPKPELSDPNEKKAWNPFENADPDFDPNASLKLEEDDSLAEKTPPQETPLVDPNIIPRPKPKPKPDPQSMAQQQAMDDIARRLNEQGGVPRASKVAHKPDEPKPSPEESAAASPNTTTAKTVSQDQKMVFSSRSAETKVKPTKDSVSALRSFSTLDDALEDLFSTGPEEDKAIRKEQDHRHFPLFRTMTTDVFVDFVMALENREFQSGDVVVRQGDPGREMFIIVDGQVDVILSMPQSASTVAKLKTGDFFGEASLITGQPRTASVVAKSATTCLVLSRNHLQQLATNHPSVVETIRSIYYTRMRENESHGK